MRKDKAQMMVLESIIFAITILISLVFLYQLSPPSTVSNSYTNTLKIKGDEALQTLYIDETPAEDLPNNGVPQDFPTKKLIYYLITDNTNALVSSNLQYMLPSSAVYNIYISNGTKTILWCNSSLGNNTPIGMVEPIAISHYMISVHPDILDNATFPDVHKNGRCKIATEFIDQGYTGSTYDVILEMSII